MAKKFSFWGQKKIQRLFHLLERQEFLLSITRYNNCYKTKFYTINYEKLGLEKTLPNPLSQNECIITPKVGDGEDKNGLSYKLITEITNKEDPPPPSQTQDEEKKSKRAKTPETILFQKMVDE